MDREVRDKDRKVGRDLQQTRQTEAPTGDRWEIRNGETDER